MKNSIIFIFLLNFITFSPKAQSKNYYDIGNKVAWALFLQMQNDKCPDSIAMYSFTVKINVDYTIKKKPKIKVNVDDSLFYKIFKNIDTLKTIDYSTLMVKRKKAELILPLGLIVLSSKSSSFRPSVDIHAVEYNIYKLLHVDKEMSSKIYFRPFLIRAELKPTD
ncbi:hypothetical protein [Pedobacter sp. L105]|uniref:hypothetical protein n=1 Tax=Pedobacter sp. L105 TaxID=1641871 RepID=UPI00131E5FF0|nr:hypothetical protein [Pedobacter sp. L105]